MDFEIFLSPPCIEGNEERYVQAAFQSNYIAPYGDFINRFEEQICHYTRSPHALALVNATSALHLALRVLGIKEGDYVLANSFTFIGSINAILYERAIPVFIDSDQSWHCSPMLLEKAIQTCTKKPKALILTHLYGQCAKLEEIVQICAHYGIVLVEDAAQALGAFYDGRHVGTFGDFGVFSFNGNKIITTSGGGMLLSQSKANHQKALYYATQAKENLPYYEHKEYGYNYRLSNICSAIGVGQCEMIEQKVAKRRQIFAWYEQALHQAPITWMPELPNTRGNRWLSAFVLRQKKHDPLALIAHLAHHKIEARPLWKPMHLQPIFKQALAFVDGTSEALFGSGVCLPSGGNLSQEQVFYIAHLIDDFVCA